MIDRFDGRLSRHLRRVAAPEDLWGRIQAAGEVKPVHRPRWARWTLAAAAATALALWCFDFRAEPASDPARLAWRELAGGSEVEFRSSDPAEIRAWVESHAGLKIPLAGGPAVEFIGVSLVHQKACTVCVSFRDHEGIGKLLVTRGGMSGPKHPSMQRTAYKGARIVSWVAAGQTYTIASSRVETPHAACVLCHADGVERKQPSHA